MRTTSAVTEPPLFYTLNTVPWQEEPLQICATHLDVLPEGSECLEVDGLQDMFGGIELQQQHDENAVVWQLLEFCLTDIMILDQHPNYDTQHLEEQHKAGSELSEPAGQRLPAQSRGEEHLYCQLILSLASL